VGQATESIAALLAVVRDAGLEGVEPGPLWALAGIDPTAPLDPMARVPTETLHDVIEHVMAVSGRTDFYVRAQFNRNLATFGALGFAVATSVDLEDALHRVCRYSGVWSTALSPSLSPEGVVAVDIDARDRPAARWRCAGFLASVVLGASSPPSGRPFVPENVHLSAVRPADTSSAERVFGVEVAWGAATDRLTIPRSELERPMLLADPMLRDALERRLAQLLATVRIGDPVIAQMREVLARLLPAGAPRLRTVARALGASGRTLQRRLDASGTSFQDLLLEVRRHLSERYLLDRSLQVAEVAFLVGFSAPSAFNRAFKRWTGSTPLEWRERAA
jgi:AraC-like DNA-binding protein